MAVLFNRNSSHMVRQKESCPMNAVILSLSLSLALAGSVVSKSAFANGFTNEVDCQQIRPAKNIEFRSALVSGQTYIYEMDKTTVPAKALRIFLVKNQESNRVGVTFTGVEEKGSEFSLTVPKITSNSTKLWVTGRTGKTTSVDLQCRREFSGAYRAN